MKTLYVDAILDGHHIAYMSALANYNSLKESCIIVPEKVEACDCKQYYYPKFTIEKGFLHYLKWLLYVRKIAKQENADIIHFLYGDLFYKYLGVGLKIFKKYKTVITFHQFRREGIKGGIKDIIFKKIMNSIDYGVVHTELLLNDIKKLGIENIEHIEYPKFDNCANISKQAALNHFKIPNNTLVLGFIGIIYDYKGLDLLLEALKDVHEPFHLLISGKPYSFDSAYIIEHSKIYKDKVTMLLKYLSDEELSMSFHACDILMLPYKKSFDGASGPLCEGVWLKKTIIGSNHGSLGYLIKKNNLGITFETENVNDLTRAISDALNAKFKWNEDAEKYRLSLTPERFLKDYQMLYENLIDVHHDDKNCIGDEKFG